MKNTIEKLILREARLLDEQKLDEWLQLYAKEATYWVPIDETVNPLKESSIIFDNYLRLAMRVEQIMNQNRVAQTPASQMLRQISNLEIELDSETEATAHFGMFLTEVRSGDWRQRGLGEMRHYPARCDLTARLIDNEWKITAKKIVLLNRYQPIVGLSFII
ncbi:MAG: aromatic-ring-hydroxylating dioxygenase subunit beta [Advenella sp.]|nr:aromatic-ring-hydroxylating dioxygenase subunit beta [Advenella sp.]